MYLGTLQNLSGEKSFSFAVDVNKNTYRFVISFRGKIHKIF